MTFYLISFISVYPSLLLVTACILSSVCIYSLADLPSFCASIVLVFVQFETLYACSNTAMLQIQDKLVDGCRSQLSNADAEQADEKEDDFVKGFKVANFEIIESPDKGTCMAAATSALWIEVAPHICMVTI